MYTLDITPWDTRTYATAYILAKLICDTMTGGNSEAYLFQLLVTFLLHPLYVALSDTTTTKGK